jgi:hypothetical protein
MSGIRTFFIPVIVGTGSLFLLEDAIEKVSNENLKKRILSKEFKILILFSAAYAANGTKVLPAIISLYIYHLITESFVEQNESENDENVSKKKPE